jgi:DNA-binding beta-propeller fold protein YncE
MGVSSWGIQCHFGPVKSNIPFPKDAIIGTTHLQSPSGVAVDLEGRVLVADFEQHKVHVFNKDGTIAQSIGAKGKDPGQFHGPRDVAVDRHGRIFVVDGGNHRVQVFNKDHTVFKVIGAVDAAGKPMEGSEPGQLSNPRGLAINNSGQILVADSGNHRVQIFALDSHAGPGGTAPASSVVRCFGSRGSDEGQLAFPHGTFLRCPLRAPRRIDPRPRHDASFAAQPQTGATAAAPRLGA